VFKFDIWSSFCSLRNSVPHSPNEKRSFARKASCGAVRLTAKPVHFLHLNRFRCKNSPFQRPGRLRMTLPRIKENLEFKNKMPVNFLTDWHYAGAGFLFTQSIISLSGAPAAA
ncbi:hypothetical protein, partial [Acinetobacter sp.]|uniref:hypothetical protein n=1 Tax=Acinetobacter sp. TaxID=472 RepID=UPI0035B29832